MNGQTLAMVQVGAKTAYFPGVVCDSPDAESIRVSLGQAVRVPFDPVSFYLVASVGWPPAQSPDAITSIVQGRRPGVDFSQAGAGWMTVDATLQKELQSNRPTDAVEAGTFTFGGTDRGSGLRLTGKVSCRP